LAEEEEFAEEEEDEEFEEEEPAAPVGTFVLLMSRSLFIYK